MVELKFDKESGLLPAIAQDYETGEVLMLAYINKDAWESTLETGKATYYSRSRKKLWVKGETSGNVQLIKDVRIDCDNDTVLYIVEQIGKASCHKGYISCFHTRIKEGEPEIIGKPLFDPKEVYGK